MNNTSYANNKDMHDLFEQRNLYLHPPVTVEEQIKILRERGMLIDDYLYASNFLKEVYFHRFLSYSVPFFANGNSRRYQLNTHFKAVVKVYEFDSRLRSLLLDAIEKIEISVRTQFINLSWKYGPHFYLNHKLFKDRRALSESIERIQYQIKAGHDFLVNEYFHCYNEPEMPPIWIVIELTSIGQLSKWLLNLKNQVDKENVARRYKVPYSVLQAILDNLTLIRNYAAHHTRIWNCKFSFDSVTVAEAVAHIPVRRALCAGDNMYSMLILITYLLSMLGIDQVFYKRLETLIEIYAINIKVMGFPDNWRTHFYDVMNVKE